MRTADFDYSLPDELIAQRPTAQRGESRLLVLDRKTESVSHRKFSDLLEYLSPGDLLVLNNSKVIPARLFGFKSVTGGKIEILLLEEIERNHWWVMLKPGRSTPAGTRITFYDRSQVATKLSGVVEAKNAQGHCRISFQGSSDVQDHLNEIGELPLPPYITRKADPAPGQDYERYQTIYASPPGSVAAPTAGLHFTAELLQEAQRRGMRVKYVTLHVGFGTFAPIKTEDIEEHQIHEEAFSLPSDTAGAISQTKAEGRRIVAVGTTSVRVLESAAAIGGLPLKALDGRTRIFIVPPFRFQVVDRLLTNFHLPRSSLLLLVSAFAGRKLVLKAYEEAIREHYRFFSYGDAMVIL